MYTVNIEIQVVGLEQLLNTKLVKLEQVRKKL